MRARVASSPRYPDRVPAPALADAVRPQGAVTRLVRSVAAALVCVASAAAGHGSAGGDLHPIAALAVFVGAASIAGLLSSRRVTIGQMAGLLLLCQVSV
ncbi:MAG: hypothetical protein JWP31_2512, partial [Aeromicrobium sp.]|nr:hypothetical protein [Aeromicrobium sp.]